MAKENALVPVASSSFLWSNLITVICYWYLNTESNVEFVLCRNTAMVTLRNLLQCLVPEPSLLFIATSLECSMNDARYFQLRVALVFNGNGSNSLRSLAFVLTFFYVLDHPLVSLWAPSPELFIKRLINTGLCEITADDISFCISYPN